MKIKISKRTIFILIIIIITAILLQTYKSGLFEKIFSVKQVYNQEENSYLNAKTPENYKEFLVIYSKNEDKELLDNVENTLKMAKLNYDIIDVNSKKLNSRIKKLKTSDMIIYATENTKGIKNIEYITKFIKEGGNISFLIRFIDNRFNEIVGIKENRGFLDENIYGFKFEKKIFPGMDSLELKNKKITHSILDMELQNTTKIYATAMDKPIIWTNNFGEGNVLYTNSTLFTDKVNRGLMLQYISLLDDYFMSYIFNSKIVNLDDFPAPIKKGKDDVIYKSYNLTNTQFFKHIWWSSMYNLSKNYNLKYTGLMIGTYTGDTRMPLSDLNKEQLKDIQYFGRRLAEVDGEIGIHGYNHNSLVLKGQIDFEEYGYNPWESKETMKKGLEIFKKTIKDIYGDIDILTYVPPSNVISKEGLKAVKETFPELKVFAGLYTGSLDKKKILSQEFGKNELFDDVYNFPRLSSGYHYSDNLMWDIYNGIASYGIVNHFIHPDDILDDNRSQGKKWKTLEEDITHIFSDIYTNYSYLRPMTNFEAYQEYKEKEKLKFYTQKNENSISIYYENFIPPSFHYLRLKDNKIKEVKGGEYETIDDSSNLYLIISEEKQVEIVLR